MNPTVFPAVGDRVKLVNTRTQDEVIVTVVPAAGRGIKSRYNWYSFREGWVVTEILARLEPTEPTEPGAYLSADGTTVLILRDVAELFTEFRWLVAPADGWSISERTVPAHHLPLKKLVTE